MRIALLVYFAVALQTTWLARPYEWAYGARLDLPLLVVISIGLTCGWRHGALCGLAAGWLMGIAAAYNVGSFALSRMVVGGVCGTATRRFSRDHPFAAPLSMAGGTLGAHLIFGFMSPADFSQPVVRLVAAVLLNTVVGTLLHTLFARFLLTPQFLRQEYALPGR
jgi:hypothetical protein